MHVFFFTNEEGREQWALLDMSEYPYERNGIECCLPNMLALINSLITTGKSRPDATTKFMVIVSPSNMGHQESENVVANIDQSNLKLICPLFQRSLRK